MKFQNIVVLLATYNGETHLAKQLDSLLAQSVKIDIVIRDDNSKDSTLDIIQRYTKNQENIHFLQDNSKSLSASQNFTILLTHVDALNKYDYIMFCDQDDIWKSDKIEQTLNKMKYLEDCYPNTPLLVHSNLTVVDEELNILDDSFWHYQNLNPYKDQFNRLLMQNPITGCTMMINTKLARYALPIPDGVVMHDWWIGIVASCFGKIGIIPDSLMEYRQHSLNDTGAKKFDIFYIIKIVMHLFDNESIKKSLDKIMLQAQLFLDNYHDKLNEKDKKILQAFVSIKSESWLKKRVILLKYHFFKQGLIRNIGLFLRI